MADHQPVIENVFHKLGGHRALGTDVYSDADLARVVHRGIHLKVLDHLGRAGFSKQEILYLRHSGAHLATSCGQERAADDRGIRPRGQARAHSGFGRRRVRR